MQVVSTQLGRLVFILNIDELLPQSGIDVPEALSMVTERYGFASSPTLQDSIQKAREQGFPFKVGKFVSKEGSKKNIQDFTIWNDGLVVNAYTTDDAEAFIDDFFSWGTEALGLRVNPSLNRIRAYLSEVVVGFDCSVDLAVRRFEAISTTIQETLKRTYENDFPLIQISSIGFDYDRSKALNAISALASFRLDRRVNHPYTDNVYFSQAPLRTEDHLHILESVETLLKA